jgi:hypothetical protein
VQPLIWRLELCGYTVPAAEAAPTELGPDARSRDTRHVGNLWDLEKDAAGTIAMTISIWYLLR